ncbi:MAG: hypothetical protein PUP46_09785 [Endozoicomonas sp. (ex Botrylloides leachii)]|nr:hypothetical protein [Endozoicomonas sp. (ex Botrylloides leachii)]
MDWKDEVISDVGKGMGIDELNFSGSGVIKFQFESDGELCIESREDRVLFYLTRQVAHHNLLDIITKALKYCHYSQAIKFPLQVGLKGNENLFLCSFLENESFNRPNIENLIETITAQFNKLTEL